VTPSQIIEPVPGTALAEDKDAARHIRERVVLPALAVGQTVTLDFRNVELATQSFIHALISAPVREYGADALKHIKFKNCTDDVQSLIITVLEYTLMAADAAAVERAESVDRLNGDHD
jgi:hypothetical protein